MDEQSQTLAPHESHPETSDERFGRRLEASGFEHADAFLDALPGRLVLDIGSGSGLHAFRFAAKGRRVVCADASKAVVDLCRSKKLRAVKADLRTFFWVVKFHGIWANVSLSRIRKDELAAAFARLDLHLTDDGVFGCSVEEGEGERMEAQEGFPGPSRLSSRFSDAEFRALVPPRYVPFRFERAAAAGPATLLNYLFRKGDA